ncbi:MAG: FdhF/YdeP family oxidoreductase, partial [Dongia sp.]
VGTVHLADFEKADCILIFGHNTTTNAPRLLHPLQEAVRRDVPIVTFNPLRERGLERFLNPQDPVQMVLGGTRISSNYYQVRTGGDIAAVLGMCKRVIESDDEAQRAGGERKIDVAFVEKHTHGFGDFAAFCRAQEWSELERVSGLSRDEMREAAEIYMRSEKVILCYGMGITQHRFGVEAVRMLVDLLLLRGNIGKPGAGIAPIRGHSNVQGQRTVGISEKAKLVPLDKLAELYDFNPPREDGLTTVDACQAILDGKVRAFISLGGNFLRAVPEREMMEKGWQRLRLSVQIATKLNRSHVVPAEITYLLPSLGRIEIDRQASGPQAVSVEDSTACIHGSRGQREPVSALALSEPAIIAGMAKATLTPNPEVDWDAWVGDYNRVRDAIERTYPDQFKDFNKRMFKPGGFARPLAARKRVWKTKTGKANFTVPKHLSGNEPPNGAFQLITLRADGQFNTTIYNESDRFRGVYDSRTVVLMNPADISELGLEAGETITLETEAHDNVHRRLSGLQVVPYDIPRHSIAGYYPECNVLIPLSHYAEEAKVPAAKSIPVRVIASGTAA